MQENGRRADAVAAFRNQAAQFRAVGMIRMESTTKAAWHPGDSWRPHRCRNFPAHLRGRDRRPPLDTPPPGVAATPVSHPKVDLIQLLGIAPGDEISRQKSAKSGIGFERSGGYGETIRPTV